MKTITQVVQNLVKPYIDNQDQAVESNIAPVETDATSSTGSYSQGEQLILNKILYDVTAAITVGDPLEVGTNIAVAPKISAAIGGKQEQIEVSSMPTASASNVGKVLIYIGETTSTYTSGQSYQSTLEGGNYIWKPTSISSVDASDVVYDNQTSGLTATDSQAAIDELASQNQTLTSAFVNNVNENGCKNILPNYVTPFSSGGANVAIDDDGIITVTASSALTGNCNIYPTGNNNIEENKRLYLPKGTYIGSGCPSGGSNSTYYVNFYNQSSSANLGYDYGEGVEFTLNSDTWIVVRASVRSGYTISDSVVFKPMITLATDVPSDYAHYVPFAKTNLQLTQDSVTWDVLSEVGAVNYFNNTASSPQTDKGVTYTVDATTKKVTATGTNDGTANSFIIVKQNLKAGIYRCSGCPSGGSNSNYRIVWDVNDSQNNYDYGDGVIITLATDGYVTAYFNIIKNYAISGSVVFEPMITSMDYNGPYVPYAKTNKELTEDVAELLNDGKPYSFGIMGSTTKPSFLNGDTLASKTILEIFNALPINYSGGSGGSNSVGSEISVGTYQGTTTLFTDIMTLTGLTSLTAGLLTIKKFEAQRGFVTYNTGNKIFNCRILSGALETCYLMELTPVT